MKTYELVEVIRPIGCRTILNIKTFTNYKKAKEEFNIRVSSHNGMKQGYKSKDFCSLYNNNCVVTIGITLINNK